MLVVSSWPFVVCCLSLFLGRWFVVCTLYMFWLLCVVCLVDIGCCYFVLFMYVLRLFVVDLLLSVV